ncbi:MAG: winged helix-turn-helix transcriptional regulator [Peptococcaceae bacterium]|nr:winged helix-turn-helix transcriptional regulator [Candidatus Syntrophopropionicum ammoniitolerans]
MREGNALALISRIRDKANRFIVRELENQGIRGIVPSHGDILVVLFKENRCTMKGLADRIYRTKSTVTILVEKLIAYGYVKKEKCYQDNRVSYISLTDKGMALKPIFNDISKKLDMLFYGHLTKKEAVAFEKTLSIIKERLDKEG